MSLNASKILESSLKSLKLNSTRVNKGSPRGPLRSKVKMTKMEGWAVGLLVGFISTVITCLFFAVFALCLFYQWERKHNQKYHQQIKTFGSGSVVPQERVSGLGLDGDIALVNKESRGLLQQAPKIPPQQLQESPQVVVEN